MKSIVYTFWGTDVHANTNVNVCLEIYTLYQIIQNKHKFLYHTDTNKYMVSGQNYKSMFNFNEKLISELHLNGLDFDTFKQWISDSKIA